MKTSREREIELEVRGMFGSAKWDKQFSKTASQIVEKIRKENGFTDFTTKERVAILESIAQCLMNTTLVHRNKIKTLKRDILILHIITGLLLGAFISLIIKVMF